MSNETTEVIIAQTKLMQLDLTITTQRMKVKELKARSDTLIARATMEDFKLEQMIKKFKGLENK